MARNKKRKNKQVKGLDDGAASSSDGDEHDTTTTTQEEQQQQRKEHEVQQLQEQSMDVKHAAAKDKHEEEEGNATKTAAATTAAANNNNKDDEDAAAAAASSRRAPVQVLYCPICTFPAEFCEFSGMYEKCRPWLLEHAAELADAVERGRKRRVLTQQGRLEAMMAGKGVKKALERAVVFETARVKGGAVTFVTGMDLFGHNLKDLSKEWRKKFSCGGGVRDADEVQKQSAIQMQGSLEAPLAELLVSKYGIPKEAIYTMQNKKRVHVY